MDYDDFLTDEEKAEKQADYEKRYVSTITELGKKFDDDEADEIYQEMMQNHNVRHSNNGGSDAELNFLRSEKAYRQKTRPDEHVAGLLKHIARSDGKSRRETAKWARENLRAPSDRLSIRGRR